MVPPNAFEPAILMKGEEIPLPQFVISYETVIKFQEFLDRLRRASSHSRRDGVTVDVCIFYYEIPSYSDKLFINA